MTLREQRPGTQDSSNALEVDPINRSESFKYGYDLGVTVNKGSAVRGGAEFPEIVDDISNYGEENLSRLLAFYGLNDLPELSKREKQYICYILAGISFSAGSGSQMAVLINNSTISRYNKKLKESGVWEKLELARQKRREFFLNKNKEGEYPDIEIGLLLNEIKVLGNGLEPNEIYRPQLIPGYFAERKVSHSKSGGIKNRSLHDSLQIIKFALSGNSVTEIADKTKENLNSLRNLLQNGSNTRALSIKTLKLIATAQRNAGQGWPSEEELEKR